MTIEDDIIEDEESSPEYTFIIMWCSEGIECCIPLDMTKLGDGANMLAQLEDRENDYQREMSRLLFMLTLRARANTQRHYEIYKLITAGITQEQIESMFESNPQGIVDLIREKGVVLYSDRTKEKPKII